MEGFAFRSDEFIVLRNAGGDGVSEYAPHGWTGGWLDRCGFHASMKHM